MVCETLMLATETTGACPSILRGEAQAKTAHSTCRVKLDRLAASLCTV